MEELMKRSLAAFAAADWDEFKATHAADVAFEEIPTGRSAKGIDDYIEAVKPWKTAFPDLAATVKRSYVVDDTLIAEVEWAGTHRGPLATPFGTLPPTNKSTRVSAVLISKIKDGKIVESRHYFDQLSVLTQLGAAAFATPPSKEAAQPAVH